MTGENLLVFIRQPPFIFFYAEIMLFSICHSPHIVVQHLCCEEPVLTVNDEASIIPAVLLEIIIDLCILCQHLLRVIANKAISLHLLISKVCPS